MAVLRMNLQYVLEFYMLILDDRQFPFKNSRLDINRSVLQIPFKLIRRFRIVPQRLPSKAVQKLMVCFSPYLG